MKIFKNGLLTGLILQLAIGPVFFFIINLTLQRTIYDGIIGALAVALIDFSYVGLATLGIGKFLKKQKIERIFNIISSTILIIFGIIILKNIIGMDMPTSTTIDSANILSSFMSVLLLTISNPLTIILYTGILATKGIENKYSQRDLFIFGLGIGFATFIFMSGSVSLFSLVKGSVPLIIIQILNGIVGCLLISYGGIRLKKTLTPKTT